MTQPFDPRRHRAQTERRLIIAGILILFVIGGGAWLSGMLCMGPACSCSCCCGAS
jgi:hypothetical protein